MTFYSAEERQAQVTAREIERRQAGRVPALLAELERLREEHKAMREAGEAFAAGNISAGKLGEVLGVRDLHEFKAAAHAFCDALTCSEGEGGDQFRGGDQ